MGFMVTMVPVVNVEPMVLVVLTQVRRFAASFVRCQRPQP